MPSKKRGGLYCSCYGPNDTSCSNTSYTEGISMHLFPVNNPVIRQKWIDFVSIHRPGFQPSRFSAVCSGHFEDSCYHQRFINNFPELEGHSGKRKKRLDRDCAVPSIIIPQNIQSLCKDSGAFRSTMKSRAVGINKRTARFGRTTRGKHPRLRRARHVVQQLKQNIQPRSDGYFNEQEFPPTYHQQVPSSSGDSVRTDRSINSGMTSGNTQNAGSHRPSLLGMSRHFNTQHAPCISPPSSTKFIPNITENNIIHLKEERETPRKPDMVTTGMQTVPAGRIERSILPKPEVKKSKVSLGIQTSKPVEQHNTGKQNAEKLNFLSTLGLITVSKCREINSQKNERRRRTSAIFSPYSSFQFFDEPKRPSTGIKRGRGRPTKNGESCVKSPVSPVFVPINGFKTPNNEHPTVNKISSDTSPKDEEHEDHCAVCQKSGEVLMCDTCILVYHAKCLTPPLTSIPPGMWMCPKCQEIINTKEPMEWPGTLAVTHSYLKHRAEKDKEKQKLLNRNQELKLQELELQRKVNELSSAIVTQIQKKTEIVESTRQAQEKLQRLKRFIQAIISS